MGQVMQDLRYGLRSLARAKLLVLIILATVGIGVGATTAMITVTRTVLVDALPYQNADGLYWIYTDNPPYRFRFSVVDYRALEADHPLIRERGRLSDRARERADCRRGGARDREERHRVLLPAARPARVSRPAVVAGRRGRARSRGRAHLRVLAASIWQRCVDRQPPGCRRWRESYGRRHSAERRRPARARRSIVDAGQVAYAHAQGALLHDGAGPAGARCVDQHGGASAPRDRRAAVSDLARVLSGRKGDVGVAGSEIARARRHWAHADARAGRRSRVCGSLPAPTRSICSSLARSAAAASLRFARPSAPRAAACCSTVWSKRRGSWPVSPPWRPAWPCWPSVSSPRSAPRTFHA